VFSSIVVPVDLAGAGHRALPIAKRWRTFGRAQPRFVEVIPYQPAIAARAGRALEAAHVRAYVSSSQPISGGRQEGRGDPGAEGRDARDVGPCPRVARAAHARVMKVRQCMVKAR
jgi:hypothetical protein